MYDVGNAAVDATSINFVVSEGWSTYGNLTALIGKDWLPLSRNHSCCQPFAPRALEEPA